MNLSQPLRHAQPVDRVAYILRLVSGKSVLHFGCTDSPFHKERYATGTLLHQRLHAVCKTLKGIDIDRESLDWLKQQEPSWDLNFGDMECAEALTLRPDFDAVLASEILEHLGNPEGALRSIRRFLKEDGVLIVSVPNALSSRNFANTVFYRENVHSQHVSWYSPRTLSELLSRSGYQIRELLPYVSRLKPSLRMPYDALHKMVQALFVWLSEGLLAVACLDHSQE